MCLGKYCHSEKILEIKISNMWEVGGARCPSCATRGFSLCKSTHRMKRICLVQLLPGAGKHGGNYNFLLATKALLLLHRMDSQIPYIRNLKLVSNIRLIFHYHYSFL